MLIRLIDLCSGRMPVLLFPHHVYILWGFFYGTDPLVIYESPIAMINAFDTQCGIRLLKTAAVTLTGFTPFVLFPTSNCLI